jgi:hypothetical protein
MINKFSKLVESNSNSIKIGLDLHGVIDAMPEFFSFFTKAMIRSGAEIHIITGGTSEKDIELLKKYNIQWTHFFSITDYHKSLGTPTTVLHPKHGFLMVSDDEWDKTKAEYCEREKIDLHIDDTLVYNDYFKTPFCRLWSHNNKPKSPDKDSKHLL